MKQMKWSEEGKKREEKYKIEVRAEETNWVFQAGENISAWMYREPHVQLTVWPLGGALLFGRNTRNTECSPSSSGAVGTL